MITPPIDISSDSTVAVPTVEKNVSQCMSSSPDPAATNIDAPACAAVRTERSNASFQNPTVHMMTPPPGRSARRRP
ncbi:Uncharacterised protein [Amycolatopsis camponoti]|uniref:Uncharacterized protein n=1 Tax=Amycolatopsis camponoti TaxID=2606593 RepID=A0A6I8M690_9PSEU|nr:Uncharacterised protein [Amycolatopsis camponoti]